MGYRCPFCEKPFTFESLKIGYFEVELAIVVSF